MDSPEIIKTDIESFFNGNQFDIYIGNPFSFGFFPKDVSAFVFERSDKVKADEIIALMSERRQKILAFGAGSVIDPAKYIAAQTQNHLTVIPSALSVNAFATHRCSFFTEERKTSINAISPHRLVLDFELLKSAGILNLMGTMELFSGATAQVDWSLAVEMGKAQENIILRSRTQELLKKAIDLVCRNEDVSKSLEELFDSLLESGLITQEYGNGRPVSGSEHIISSYIENRTQCAHGVGLYVAILISTQLQVMSGIQNEILTTISNLLWNSPIIKEYVKSKLEKEILKQILLTVKPSDEKYTILNLVSNMDFKNTSVNVCDRLFM